MNGYLSTLIFTLFAIQAASLHAEQQFPTTIVKHLRSTEGIPFPERATNVDKPKIEPGTADFSFVERVRAQFRRGRRDRSIPECKDDRTDKTLLRKLKKKEEPIGIFDVIFIRAEQLPRDPDLAFGVKTKIFQYSEDNGAANIAINGSTISCLPFRMRMTSGYLFTDQGLNALKNYEQDLNGPGILTEPMKVKLANKNAL